MSTKKSNTAPKKARKPILARSHYYTARWLDYAYREGLQGDQATITRFFNRLMREAGITDYKKLSRYAAYVAAMHAILERTERATSENADRLSAVVSEVLARERRIRNSETTTANHSVVAPPKVQTGSKSKPAPKQLTVGIAPTCDYWRTVGIFAGDVVTLTPAAADLQPRRIIAVYQHAGADPDGRGFNAGRFLHFNAWEVDGLEGKHAVIVLEMPDGEEMGFLLETWTPHHFTAAPRQKAQSKQIAELKRKLETLDFEPQNEACRFKLEVEIYELERQARADEWPEFIN